MRVSLTGSSRLRVMRSAAPTSSVGEYRAAAQGVALGRREGDGLVDGRVGEVDVEVEFLTGRVHVHVEQAAHGQVCDVGDVQDDVRVPEDVREVEVFAERLDAAESGQRAFHERRGIDHALELRHRLAVNELPVLDANVLHVLAEVESLQKIAL